MALTFLSLVATNGILVGIVEGSSRSFKDEWTGDLFITNRNERSYIEHTNDIENMLTSFPQVVSHSKRIIAGTKIEANWWEKRRVEDTNAVSNQIAGIDPVNEEATTHISKVVVEGEWLKAGDTEGIVLGSGYLKKYSKVADLVSLLHDVKPGTIVRVTVSKTVPNLELQPGGNAVPVIIPNVVGSVTKDFVVRGIIDSKVQFVSSRAYILDSELKKMMGKTDGDVSEIAITLQPDVDPYTVKTPLINNGFSDYAKINTATEGSPEFLINIKLFFGIIGTLLGSISIVVALITIFIIIYINALTRRKQIGIMKAVGVTEFAIESSYIYQALFYVITGSLIAIVFVFTFLKPFMSAHPINTPFATIVLVADPLSVLLKLVLVTIVSIFAGYLPARFIVNTNTLNAILGRNN